MLSAMTSLNPAGIYYLNRRIKQQALPASFYKDPQTKREKLFNGLTEPDACF